MLVFECNSDLSCIRYVLLKSDSQHGWTARLLPITSDQKLGINFLLAIFTCVLQILQEQPIDRDFYQTKQQTDCFIWNIFI